VDGRRGGTRFLRDLRARGGLRFRWVVVCGAEFVFAVDGALAAAVLDGCAVPGVDCSLTFSRTVPLLSANCEAEMLRNDTW